MPSHTSKSPRTRRSAAYKTRTASNGASCPDTGRIEYDRAFLNHVPISYFFSLSSLFSFFFFAPFFLFFSFLYDPCEKCRPVVNRPFSALFRGTKHRLNSNSFARPFFIRLRPYLEPFRLCVQSKWKI